MLLVVDFKLNKKIILQICNEHLMYKLKKVFDCISVFSGKYEMQLSSGERATLERG